MTESLLNAHQLGELLGFAAGTVVDWAEAGTVPAFKLGGRLRFRESEVLAWLEQRRLNGLGAGGEVSPTPTADPAHGLVLQVSPTPLRGGEDA